ncbi:MAG TPA: pirin-like C-terminal cupin domain-containing protein, partial [Bdellovibrionota bacterium]|nr:pirin-like C-terminal cupin domain-containing protein [Bdellovibrionota bacterium]
GQAKLADGETIYEAEVGLLDREGHRFTVKAEGETRILVLNGQPLHEPVVGYGPFVMSTQGDIRQAFLDYQGGKMGHLPK